MSRKKPLLENVTLAGAANLAGAALLLALPAVGQAAPVPHVPGPASKCDAALLRLLDAPRPAGRVSVIARMTGALTPSQTSRLTALGVAVGGRLTLIQSLDLRVPTRNLGALAALPFVSHLSYDGPVKKCDMYQVGSSGAGAVYQQYGLTGAGVGVAVLDSGISAEDDLKTLVTTGPSSYRITYSPSFVSGEPTTDDACGHGTHVAGIIAGNGADSTGAQYYHTVYGIARQANLVSVRVLDQNGASTVSAVIWGVQWAVANKSKYNIRVMNLSLGHPVGESSKTDPLCQAVEAAWKAGIVVVCAAGNGGRLNTTNTAGASKEGWGTAYGTIQSPGNDPYVITVGAMKNIDWSRSDDRIATYSSRGPSRLDMTLKPDIVAGGNRIISLYTSNGALDQYITANGGSLLDGVILNNVWDNTPSTSYFFLSGTSMASPVVAGAAALLLQKYPSLSPDTVKARLMASADKWAFPDGTADPCTFGAGYLDIPSALTNTATVPKGQCALSPQLLQDASGNVFIDTSVIGSRSVWGSGSLTDLRSVWGTRSVWGSSYSDLSASSASLGALRSVWGSRSVWGAGTAAVDLSSVALNGEN